MNYFSRNKNGLRCQMRRNFLPLSVLGLTMSSFFVACKPGLPDGVIPESEMEKILYDYHVAQAMAESRLDSVSYYRYLYVRSVFEKYGISESEFDSSMVWYSANATYLAEMYARINERYAAELEALGSGNNVDLYASLSATGDTANIWHDTDFCLLRPGGQNSHYSFTLETDTSFYPGDDILWQFKNFYVYQEGMREAYAALIVHYDNDSIASVYQYLSSNNTADLMIKTSGKERIRSLTGFVYLTSSENDESDVFRMLILNDFKLIRFHKQTEEILADSLKHTSDSLMQHQDSLDQDSLKTPTQKSGRGLQERKSPKELRDNQPVERKIHVVKEKSRPMYRYSR